MKKTAIIVAALIAAATARAQDYQGAVVWKIETTTTNTVSWDGQAWETDGLFELYAHPGVHGVRIRSWNVPGMAAPTEAELAALATNETAQAYRAIPRGAAEEAWVSLITSVGGSLPVAEGDIVSLTASIKGQIAAKKALKDTAIASQDWATAFARQAEIDELTQAGTEITALAGQIGSRKYIIK